MYQTRSYIDALGKRLAKEAASEDDVRAAASFFQSYWQAYKYILDSTRALGYEPSGRFPKSLLSVIAKIQRERTRLTSMQDIAGIRLVVATISEQDSVVEKLRPLSSCKVIDRRVAPQHGYRAVHLIFNVDGCPVEAQIRTRLQHLWAEISEKLADQTPGLKYGKGPGPLLQVLDTLSKATAAMERLEQIPAVAEKTQESRRQFEEALVSLSKNLTK